VDAPIPHQLGTVDQRSGSGWCAASGRKRRESWDEPAPEHEELGLEQRARIEGDALVQVLDGITLALLVPFLCGMVLAALRDPRWQGETQGDDRLP
jgi:hypothetical protein